MTIDHIAWLFADFSSPIGQTMHFIGRITAPLMCYFAAEGYSYTRNLRKYISRLGIFAIIAHLPYAIFENHNKIDSFSAIDFLFSNTSIMFTIFLGVIALSIYKYEKLSKWLKTTLIVSILILSNLGDGMCFVVLWILFYGIYHDNKPKQIISGEIIAVMLAVFILIKRNDGIYFWQFGTLLAPLLILCYNNKRGSKKPIHKWLFYIYYPLHLLLLALIFFLLN